MFDVHLRRLCLGLLLLGAAVTCSCNKPLRRTSLYIAIDTSDSNHSHLTAQSRQAINLVSSLDSVSGSLRLWRFDANVRPFYAGPPIHSRERLAHLLAAELTPVTSDRFTAFSALWGQLADAVEHSDTDAVVVVFSDGVHDGATTKGRAAERAAIQRLAASPRLGGVAVVGLRDIAWGSMQADLSPVRARVGDSGLILIGDHDPDISPVRDLLARLQSRPVSERTKR